jgi:polyphenol oxidase
MPFQSNAGIRYYQFEQLGKDLIQCVFTRQGGCSPDPWTALNLGGTVGDDPERVCENRRRALAALERPLESVYDVWQVHGVNVAIADAPRLPEAPYLKADAILTNTPGVTLMMRFADCVPVFLHDPVAKVVGIAHAGWMGTVQRTLQFAVEAMQARYGSRPSDILAGIGPSIGPDHYEIGTEVVNQVRQTFGQAASGLLVERAGVTYFDLWAANRRILEQAGVMKIELAGLCTACHTEDWYSHRAEKGQTGRFGAIIALNA